MSSRPLPTVRQKCIGAIVEAKRPLTVDELIDAVVRGATAGMGPCEDRSSVRRTLSQCVKEKRLVSLAHKPVWVLDATDMGRETLKVIGRQTPGVKPGKKPAKDGFGSESCLLQDLWK